MKVQQINGQLNDSSRDVVVRDSGQGGPPPTSPAIFDASDTGDARNNNSSNADSVPDATLTAPANGAPGSTFVQQSNGVENVWKRDENGKPLLVEAYGAKEADGSRTNIATSFRLGDDGEPHLIGARVVPGAPHDRSNDDTPLTVFRRGFEDGFTHPGQTIGKITDMETGNTSGKGEKAGEKADGILEKLPVVGNALKLTRGMVGQKEPDGSPQLASPDVQPDLAGATRGAGRARELPENLPSKTPSMKQTGSHAEAAPEKPAGATNAAAAPVSSQSAKSRIDAPHMAKPGQGAEAGTNASSTTGVQSTVPTGYARTPSGPLRADPDTRGLFLDNKGQAFIRAGDQTYPVRYDRDNGTWRVYRPDDPAKPQYPVRANGQGDWQVHNDVGLKGGGGDSQRPGIGGAQQGNIPLDLQMRQMQLQNQRQDLVNQINQFPGPQHAHRSPLELAQLHHMLINQRNHLDQQLQQLQQQLNQQ